MLAHPRAQALVLTTSKEYFLSLGIGLVPIALIYRSMFQDNFLAQFYGPHRQQQEHRDRLAPLHEHSDKDRVCPNRELSEHFL